MVEHEYYVHSAGHNAETVGSPYPPRPKRFNMIAAPNYKDIPLALLGGSFPTWGYFIPVRDGVGARWLDKQKYVVVVLHDRPGGGRLRPPHTPLALPAHEI